MSKKFTKILLGLTAAGTAGAGIYYWLKNKKHTEPEDEFADDFEDDDFEDDGFEDDGFKLDDDLGEVSERGYVSLTPSAKSEEDADQNTENDTNADNDIAETETEDK